MDDQKKGEFQLKFYSLVVLLNVIILLVAGAAIAFFLAPGFLKMPLILIFLIAAAFLAYVFRERYYTTKRWLYENTGDQAREQKDRTKDA
jgi:hypothetical protein